MERFFKVLIQVDIGLFILGLLLITLAILIRLDGWGYFLIMFLFACLLIGAVSILGLIVLSIIKNVPIVWE